MKASLKNIFFAGMLLTIICHKITRAQNQVIDSLKIAFANGRDDTSKVKTLVWLSWELINVDDYSLAMRYANDALQICNNNNYSEEKDKRSKTVILEGKANTYNNMGLINWNQGNYPQALENYYATLKIWEEIDNKRGIAKTYGNIGLIFMDLHEYQQALEYQQKDLKIATEIGDKRIMLSAYNNIGLAHFDLKNYDEALKNHFASLELRKEMGLETGMAYSYNNIGLVYQSLGNYEKALEYYFASLEIKERFDDKRGTVSCYINIASIYTQLGKFKYSKEYLVKAMRISLEIGHKQKIMESYEASASLDSAAGNWKSALENYKMCILYKDSLVNEENTKKTIQQQMQYEFDKKESLLKEEQVRQSALAEEQSKRQKLFLILVGAIALAVALIAGIIFRSLRITRRQKTVIEKQKNIVEEKQNEILDSIHYARRIQQSLLPTEKYIDKSLKKWNK